jgi:hypothetical protein
VRLKLLEEEQELTKKLENGDTEASERLKEVIFYLFASITDFRLTMNFSTLVPMLLNQKLVEFWLVLVLIRRCKRSRFVTFLVDGA